jgi:membrane fusion protein (multidrug efflux system)
MPEALLSKRNIVALAVVLVAAGGAWLYFDSGSGARAPKAPVIGRGPGAIRPVIAVPVHKELFGDSIEAIGTLYANESVTVTAKTQGIIRTLDFDDGQTVKKGEQIASVDAGAEDAQVRVELANLEQQRKELERAEMLAKDSHVSQARVDEITASVKKAEANVSAANVRSGDRRIIAPFSGIVGTRRISVGALVSPGTVVTTLDDIAEVKLDFAIPETFMTALRPGLDIDAVASAYPGETFKGRVIAVDSRIDPVTRSVTVRAMILNDDLRLRPGMLMVVDLIKDQRESLMIPEAALLPENDKQYVFTISPDNVATRVEVTIGRRRTGSVEILAGLKEGDLVIKEGLQDLPSGAKITIVNTSELKGHPPQAGEGSRQPI